MRHTYFGSQVKVKKISNKGFTILELMIVVALLAILLGIAVPSFSDFVERQAVKSDMNRLSKIFTSARAQAMTLEVGATSVCWNSTLAATAPANLTSAGAIIPPRSVVSFAGDAVVGYGELLSVMDVDVNRLSYRTNDNDNCVSFSAQGRLTQSNASGASFVVCKDSADASDAFRVDITIGGRISVRDNTSVVNVNGANVGALSCT